MSFKIDFFNNSVKNKDLTAVHSHGSSWSYETLLKYSNNINSMIENHKRVGLYFEKSKEYILALFSLTLSDSAFVPLELISPEDRLEYIISDAGLEVVLTSKNYSKEDLNKLPENITVLFIEDLMIESEFSCPNPENKDEPAYIIYTSGSTGKPKGVEVSYNGLPNVINQQIDIMEMDKSKFFLYLAISFDASLSDIYCSLLSSSEIYIYDCLKRNALGLQEYFNKEGITHSDLPPSFLKLLSPTNFKTLKSVIIGGEVADYYSIQEYVKVMNVINVYGPTEATICTSMIKCDEEWSKPLIGHALENVEYKVVDENENEITKDQIGVSGELIIGGCQLALGYLNNPEMTNSRFKTMFGENFYKSGDLVDYNEDGLLEFKGRVDRQIKYHGYLICLEEIESAFNSIYEVKSITVLFKNKKLYAYYEGQITESEIREKLKNKIPSYMIPSFILNKEIPKTVTGKNDGKLLSLEDTLSDEVSVISTMFKEILEMSEEEIINPEYSFISDYNADSLDFVRLHIELQQIGLNIQYDYLIENNSVNDILKYNEKELKITTSDLISDFNNLEMPTNIRKIGKQKNQQAFMTGTTGLLGSKLLEKVSLSYDKVYCLVRANTVEQGKERLLNVLLQNKITLTQEQQDKIEVITGDLSERNFGLSSEKYSELTTVVDTVFHCAANVNNILTYKQLFKSNVLTTVNVAKFIFDGRDKELHYASTLSVYVSSNSLDNSSFPEVPLIDDGHRLYSGYAQSKWLSEYYLGKINEQSDNVFIYRFGLLTPSLKTFISSGDSFLNNCIQDLKEIGSIPKTDIEISMDITPLEIAVDAMYLISKESTANIFHVTSNYQLTLNKMSELLNINEGSDVIEWLETYSNYKVTQHMTDLNNPYMKQHNMNLFETTKIRSFGVENSIQYIDDFDIESYLMILIK